MVFNERSSVLSHRKKVTEPQWWICSPVRESSTFEPCQCLLYGVVALVWMTILVVEPGNFSRRHLFDWFFTIELMCDCKSIFHVRTSEFVNSPFLNIVTPMIP